MSKKGFTLIELMVVVAIISILTAVALPMYSTFKQKARVGSAMNAAKGTTQALQAWFTDTFNFNNIDVNANIGGALKDTANNIRIGSGLPEIPDLTWTIIPSGNKIAIAWAYSDGCPGTDCDGKLCLECFANNDLCRIGIDVEKDDLGFDQNIGSCP